VSFIVPAFLIVLLVAANYERLAETDVLDRLRYGIYPVVVAIIAVALVQLRKSTLGTPLHAAIGMGSVVLFVVGVPELLVLAIGGVVAAALSTVRSRLNAVAVLAAAVVVPELWRILLRFAEIGSVVFGSGYVLFAFLDSMLVQRDGWIGESVLLDAIAVGQVTPGPVFTSATFIGWEIDGLAGAAVATLGIFLPSFLFAVMCAWFVRAVERTAWLQSALGGVTAASIALMAVLVVRLGDLSLNDVGTWALFAVALGAMLLKRVGSMWMIGLGLLAGLAFGG
jgi:chromate transporter